MVHMVQSTHPVADRMAQLLSETLADLRAYYGAGRGTADAVVADTALRATQHFAKAIETRRTSPRTFERAMREVRSAVTSLAALSGLGHRTAAAAERAMAAFYGALVDYDVWLTMATNGEPRAHRQAIPVVGLTVWADRLMTFNASMEAVLVFVTPEVEIEVAAAA